MISKVIKGKYSYPLAVAGLIALAVCAVWTSLTSFIPGLTVQSITRWIAFTVFSLDDSIQIWTHGYFVQKYGMIALWVFIIIAIATAILIGQSKAENDHVRREQHS